MYHHPVKPQSSQSIYHIRNFQQPQKKASFLPSFYNIVTFISAAGTTSQKVVSLMKSCYFAPPASPVDSVLNAHCSEHCRCFSDPGKTSCLRMDHVSIPGCDRAIFQRFSYTHPEGFSLLFFQSKGGTSGTPGDISTGEFHLRRFSSPYVFYSRPFLLEVFILLVFI